MPTYDYQCRLCGHTIEVIHSMLEEGPTACERCGGELRRVFHPTGIIFRGSGFYKTDSRSAGGSSTGAKEPAPSGSDGSAGGESSKGEGKGGEGKGGEGKGGEGKGGDAAQPSGQTPSGESRASESG